MNCGILTFYFAHNYGAVLQAYALQTYISKLGHATFIVKRYPDKLKREYSLNPFCDSKSIRNFLRKCKAIPKRMKQYTAFEKFINKNFNFSEGDLDAIVCGSDQIWNEKITGETSLYYGANYKSCPIKISYAASFGSNKLTPFETKCVKEYLTDFQAISLREKDCLTDVARLTGKDAKLVLDPVFLLDVNFWTNFASRAKYKIKEKYILYYSLKEDRELIAQTRKLSVQTNCTVLCIHPTCSNLHVGWKQLHTIGPYEFVSLIKNAESIATNSFHAIAFSIIFEKKTLYKSFSKTDNRVESLLKSLNASHLNKNGLYDFSAKDERNIENYLNESKKFLMNALGNNTENV